MKNLVYIFFGIGVAIGFNLNAYACPNSENGEKHKCYNFKKEDNVRIKCEYNKNSKFCEKTTNR